MIPFCFPLDGVLATLAAEYVPGSGKLTLSDVSRIAAVQPPGSIRLTVETPEGMPLSQFIANTRTQGNQVSVTLDPLSDYTDVALPAGSIVGVSASAGAFREIHRAVYDLNNSIVPLITAAPAVKSVAGRTGIVSLTTADIGGLGSIATHGTGDFLSSTGTVPPPHLGGGTPSGSTFLRGDGQWATPLPAPVSYDDLTDKPTIPAPTIPAGSTGHLQFASNGVFAAGNLSTDGKVLSGGTSATGPSSTLDLNANGLGAVVFALAGGGRFVIENQDVGVVFQNLENGKPLLLENYEAGPCSIGTRGASNHPCQVQPGGTVTVQWPVGGGQRFLDSVGNTQGFLYVANGKPTWRDSSGVDHPLY